VALLRVFVDSNELFPFTIMDLILTLAEDQLFEFVWSEELLDEWERVIVREGQRTQESARSVASTVRESFKDGRIDPTDYRDKEWPELPDLDDRVHGAAATSGADVLLTRDLGHFPPHMLPKLIITTSDEYLTSLFRHRQRDFIASLRKLAASKRRPPVTDCEYVVKLRNAGCMNLARALARPLGCN
jgi:predicted nucleic acid-binding protein